MSVGRFAPHPWQLRESSLDLRRLAHSESLFALANGHLGLRGNLDEGEPFGLPGTYLNSVHELRPQPYAEAGYGYPESGQSMINVTNGKLIRLLVDDEPFDVRYGKLRLHQRTLDMQSGLLHREVEWESPAGKAVKVSSTRLVSFTQRAVAAIDYRVEPLDGETRLVVQSELVANEPCPPPGRDPRMATTPVNPLIAEHQAELFRGSALVHRTASSGITLAAGMDHLVDSPEDRIIESVVSPDVGRVTVATVIEPGQTLRITKFLAYGWSEVRSRQALFDQVVAALTAARHTTWDGLLEDQRGFLDDFWHGADVEVEGDLEIQRAVRFGLFHVLQAGARAERRPIPAKGLTGTGYEGHTFWDSEVYVLPVLTYTHSRAVADELRWRHSTLPQARRRASTLGFKGAAFPWRTISGDECSGYWPAGTAAFHINAGIAHAAARYFDATQDEEFDREIGVDLLVETARLWRSLGHYDSDGNFRIDGVTGPDEYSAIDDNNVYTNLMAQSNLRAAADSAERNPLQAGELSVESEELAGWRQAADAMYVPYDERLKVHPQSEGFTVHEVWDFERTDPDHYPLMLHYPYFDLYRKQVVKQADLVLAMYLRPDFFDIEHKARNFVYYEQITVRDSSLSAAIQSVLAAEVGHLELAYDYLWETALVDMGDLHGNCRDGIHLAAQAGVWTSLVAGFGGLRVAEGEISFAPRLPEALTRLAFSLCYRDRRIYVNIDGPVASYALKRGKTIGARHHGHPFTLSEGDPVELIIPPLVSGEAPRQPRGREPARHRSRSTRRK
jgi:alpha,alpha-trehalose phosphorylase